MAHCYIKNFAFSFSPESQEMLERLAGNLQVRYESALQAGDRRKGYGPIFEAYEAARKLSENHFSANTRQTTSYFVLMIKALSEPERRAQKTAVSVIRESINRLFLGQDNKLSALANELNEAAISANLSLRVQSRDLMTSNTSSLSM